MVQRQYLRFIISIFVLFLVLKNWSKFLKIREKNNKNTPNWLFKMCIHSVLKVFVYIQWSIQFKKLWEKFACARDYCAWNRDGLDTTHGVHSVLCTVNNTHWLQMYRALRCHAVVVPRLWCNFNETKKWYAANARFTK